jgi:chemotaxis protein MotB
METRSRFSWIAAAVLVSAVLAAGCGVSKSKYLEATKSRDELAAKNTELQTSLDQANKDKAQLQADKAAVDEQLKTAQAAAQTQQASSDQAKTTYEQMVSHLQDEVKSGEVEIKQLKDVISVNLAQDILFPVGSADLDKQGTDLLLKVADDLKASPFKVLVTGHTDNAKITGALAKRYPTNWELGGARAARIVRLLEDAGIAKDRLAAISFADSRPREANDTPEGRAKNRRIEIKLTPGTTEAAAAN